MRWLWPKQKEYKPKNQILQTEFKPKEAKEKTVETPNEDEKKKLPQVKKLGKKEGNTSGNTTDSGGPSAPERDIATEKPKIIISPSALKYANTLREKNGTGREKSTKLPPVQPTINPKPENNKSLEGKDDDGPSR